MSGSGFATLVEGFFHDWLAGAMRVSENTIASYRDAFALYLRWMSEERGTAPCDVELEMVSRENVLAFLSHLADVRGCSPKTVNCRLAAIKSFCSYAAYRRPDRLEQLNAVRGIPQRRERRREAGYLTPEEAGWLVEACPEGSESRLLVLMLYSTGARVSELVGLRARDVSGPAGGRLRVSLLGKGRKERTIPLWEDVSRELSSHMEAAALGPGDYIFRGRGGGHLTRSGARHRIDAAMRRASEAHPSLSSRRVSPHTFRHSCAMSMLAAGIDIGTVAIWLGHESINTAHRYVVSDMRLKEEGLSKVRRDWQAEAKEHRAYRASEDIMEFLKGL